MNPLRARLPIAEIGSNDKHVAGEAEREQSLILETDIHTKNSIVDGMANVIDDLASYPGVLPAPHVQAFFHEFVQLLPLLGSYRGYGYGSSSNDLWLLRHGCSPTPLLSALRGALFFALLLGFPTTLFFGNH
jgi:hypothetical protein